MIIFLIGIYVATYRLLHELLGCLARQEFADWDMIPAFPLLRTALDTRFDLWAWIKSDFLPAAVVGPIEDPEATARTWNPPVETFTPNPEATQLYRDRRRLFDDVYTALVPLFPRLHV